MARPQLSAPPRSALEAIARATRTPFYLLDLDGVVDRVRAMQRAWSERLPGTTLAYSYKTNSIPAVTRLLRQRGCGAEVVSGTELGWALDDGFTGPRIYFDGPLKTADELMAALVAGARIQLDSPDEAMRMVEVAAAVSARAVPVSLRLATPYHRQLSRLGMSLSEAVAAQRIVASAGLTVSGVHLHFGSNLPTADGHRRVLSSYLPFIRDLMARADRRFVLDVGGGFPSSSLGADDDLPSDETFADAVSSALAAGDVDPADLRVVIEPGRSLVEDCGWLLTRIASIKHRGDRRLAIVDAGLNLLPSVGSWQHDIEFLGARTEQRAPVVLFGSQCFESDLLAPDLDAPADLAAGDLLVFSQCGAYDLATARGWTRQLPPVFALWDGRIECVRDACFGGRDSQSGSALAAQYPVGALERS
jgi:diaminopimelate decarboxylase